MSGISQTGFQSFSQTRIQSTSQSRSYSSNVSRGGLLHSDHSHASELPPKPKKRIIICCDGTWQSSAHGTHTIPSNVAKMSRSIASWYIDENELMAPQIVYYDAGVGTAMGRLGQKWAGTFGGGLNENVCEAYNFLVNNYSPGDELFFFGFSRGAYTARACAGLVCRVGICKPSAMGQFWKMYTQYQALKPHEAMEASDWGKGAGSEWLHQTDKNVTIKVVGVWDTVGSLGYPDNKWYDLSHRNTSYGFHNTEIHPQIDNAFHALALEEHRMSFGPTLWSLPENSKTNLIQCWFPGVHINIGGGSGDGLKAESKGDLEIMSITTFFWMVDRCFPFLRFDIDPNIASDYQKALDKMIGKSEKTRDGKVKEYGGWGVAPIVDSFEGVLALAGSETRTPGHYFLDEHTQEHRHKETKEYMHPVIAHAQEQIGYAPPALLGFNRVQVSEGKGEGYKWVKKYERPKPGYLQWGYSLLFGQKAPSGPEEDLVEIPEFVIPAVGYNEAGETLEPHERWLIRHAANRSAGRQASEEEIKVDKEGLVFLEGLDEANTNTKEFNAWKGAKFANTNPKYPLKF